MALNWEREKRRQRRIAEIRERSLESADPSTGVFADEPVDTRPKCIACDLPVTPEGDEAKLLSSGSWLHETCMGAHPFKITAEVSFVQEIVVRAVSEDGAIERYLEALKVLNGDPGELEVAISVEETEEAPSAPLHQRLTTVVAKPLHEMNHERLRELVESQVSCLVCGRSDLLPRYNTVPRHKVVREVGAPYCLGSNVPLVP